MISFKFIAYLQEMAHFSEKTHELGSRRNFKAAKQKIFSLSYSLSCTSHVLRSFHNNAFNIIFKLSQEDN
jgi:hypothetical protein